jgi:hypothetical protein
MKDGARVRRQVPSPSIMDCPTLSFEDVNFSVTATLEQLCDDYEQSKGEQSKDSSRYSSSPALGGSGTRLLAAAALSKKPQEVTSGKLRAPPPSHANGGDGSQVLPGAGTASNTLQPGGGTPGAVRMASSTLRAPPHANGGGWSESLSGADQVVVGNMSPRTPRVVGARVRHAHGSSFVPRGDRRSRHSQSDTDALSAWKSADPISAWTSTTSHDPNLTMDKSQSLVFGDGCGAPRRSEPASCPLSVAPAKGYDLQQDRLSCPRDGLVLGSSPRKSLHKQRRLPSLGRVSIGSTGVPRSSATIATRRRLDSTERPQDFALAVENVKNLATYDASRFSLEGTISAARSQLEFHSFGGNHLKEVTSKPCSQHPKLYHSSSGNYHEEVRINEGARAHTHTHTPFQLLPAMVIFLPLQALMS